MHALTMSECINCWVCVFDVSLLYLSLEGRPLSFFICLVGLLSIEEVMRNTKSDQLICKHCKGKDVDFSCVPLERGVRETVQSVIVKM